MLSSMNLWKIDEKQLEAYIKNYEYQNSILKVQETISDEKSGTKGIGGHYLSGAWRQKVKIIKNNGEEDEFSFFIKAIPEGAFARNYVISNGLFGKELKAYQDVLPAYERLMKENGDYSEPLWPKFIGYKPYSYLILEDLAKKGYRGIDGKIGLDLQHSLIVFQTLAKFHALSVIIIERSMIETIHLEKNHFILPNERRNRTMGEKLSIISKLIKKYGGPSRQKIAQQLEEVSKDPLNVLQKMTTLNENGFNVLNHGDSWTSNLMFKYSQFSKEVISCRLVDFQILNYNSFALDLNYVLHSSVMTKERERLLSAYHSTVYKTFKRYNHEPKNFPTLQKLKEEVENKAMYGIIVSLYLLELMHQFEDDVTLESLGSSGGVLSDRIINDERFLPNVFRIIEPYENVGAKM